MLLATIQVRVPIGSGWAATDVMKISEIVTGSGVSLATKYLAFFRCGRLYLDCLADRQIGYAQNDDGACGVRWLAQSVYNITPLAGGGAKRHRAMDECSEC
jgi:hypothetical protein